MRAKISIRPMPLEPYSSISSFVMEKVGLVVVVVVLGIAGFRVCHRYRVKQLLFSYNNNKNIWNKKEKKSYSRKKEYVVATISILVFLVLQFGLLFRIIAGKSSTNLFSPYEDATTTAVIQEKAERHNKVVLLGPHDRYNFGDLLFSRVLTKLLVSRAGYSPEDILYGGIATVNMSSYGGPSSVLNMKRVQALSRSDGAPYDIIFTGGEATRENFDRALDKLPNEEMRIRAMKDKVHGCAYLFPKRLLLPLPENTLGDAKEPSNYAIINSMGGDSVRKDCREAVETADYLAWRDHAPLFPDSAVMTKELFSAEIDAAANDVVNELFPTRQKKFVAVQHKQGIFVKPNWWEFSLLSRRRVSKEEELASALDEVSRNLNATIVFFAAGTAPGHDSIQYYKDVATNMKEEAIVYEGEHIWKVIGLISKAEAVLSTSLHVRVMAFLYNKPRVTWCYGFKHRKFIELWDTDASARCEATKSNTWKTLRNHYYSSSPRGAVEATAATANEAKKKYDEVVQQYLESFNRFSSLLRPQSKK